MVVRERLDGCQETREVVHRRSAVWVTTTVVLEVVRHVLERDALVAAPTNQFLDPVR